ASWKEPLVVTVREKVGETAPEKPSAHAQVTVTSLSFQPYGSGAGVLLCNAIDGRTLSIRIVLDAGALRWGAQSTAVHVTVVFSVVCVKTIPRVDPLVVPPRLQLIERTPVPPGSSSALKMSVTFELFQPLSFGPGVTIDEIRGGVESSKQSAYWCRTDRSGSTATRRRR